jgi:signal transduction histidine kinase
MDVVLSVVPRPYGRHHARERAASMKTSSIGVWMVVALAIVVALASWDEERESSAMLADFGQEQATLAESVGTALRARLAATPKDGPALDNPVELLSSIRGVERAGALRVLIQRPSQPGFVTTDGGQLRSAPLEQALDARTASVRLSRSEAATLGLPARMAVAGLTSVDAGSFGRWGVAVVATAQRERDRQRRAEWRLVLGVSVAAALVLAFGGLALRTQRKELELARELESAEIANARDERLVRADKLATMGALATGIAHEVSTPLGVIAGRAEQLSARVQGDEKARRSVQVISEQAERIDGIIRGFLSLARGNAPTLEHVSPSEIVQSALDLVEHRFEKAGVSVHADVGTGLPRIACEPRLFEQVLVNLLLNACDACEPGSSVVLSVRADAERVAFVVTDDGSGISEEAAVRATEPFFTTKAEGKGTGLGLAIANEIVKHHGGSLTIARADTGTRASVEIPTARSHDG